MIYGPRQQAAVCKCVCLPVCVRVKVRGGSITCLQNYVGSTWSVGDDNYSVKSTRPLLVLNMPAEGVSAHSSHINKLIGSLHSDLRSTIIPVGRRLCRVFVWKTENEKSKGYYNGSGDVIDQNCLVLTPMAILFSHIDKHEPCFSETAFYWTTFNEIFTSSDTEKNMVKNTEKNMVKNTVSPVASTLWAGPGLSFHSWL